MSSRQTGKALAVILGVLIAILATAWIVGKTLEVREKPTSAPEVGPQP
jgi:hypothetical protein